MRKGKTLIFTAPLALLLLLFAGYQYGYVKLNDRVASLREEKEVKMNTLKKYARVIAEKEVLEERFAALEKERKRNDERLISGDTPSIAAANLLDMVKSAITGRGGRISSERVGKSGELEDLKVIKVNVVAVMPDSAALADMLFALETRIPSIVVDELEVRVVNIRDPREINVKLDVSSLMEKG